MKCGLVCLLLCLLRSISEMGHLMGTQKRFNFVQKFFLKKEDSCGVGLVYLLTDLMVCGVGGLGLSGSNSVYYTALHFSNGVKWLQFFVFSLKKNCSCGP